MGIKAPRGYDVLWEQLLAAIERNLAVCPFSSFRRTESELMPEIYDGGIGERDLYETASELWCGVEFQGFPEVLRSQVRSSLRRFLGTGSQAYDVAQGFTGYPHAPCESQRLEPPSARFASWTQWTKDYHEREGMAPPVGDFSAQKLLEAQATIENLYVRPALSFLQGRSDIWTVSSLEFCTDLWRAYSEFTGIEADGFTTAEFLKSEEMAETPFINIHSSLVAGMIAHTPERRRRGSDLEDVLGISTVLPYCDILTTDGGMKDLVCRLGLDSQYDSRVFSARRSDVDAIRSLAEELTG